MAETNEWNSSINAGDTWTADGITYHELVQQPYPNCVFAAGAVIGHAVERVYLRWERPNDQGGMLLLTADEGAAIAHVLTGALWSVFSQLHDIIPPVTSETTEQDNSPL